MQVTYNNVTDVNNVVLLSQNNDIRSIMSTQKNRTNSLEHTGDKLVIKNKALQMGLLNEPRALEASSENTLKELSLE